MFNVNTQSFFLRSILSIGGCVTLLALIALPIRAEIGSIDPTPSNPEILQAEVEQKLQSRLPAYLETLQQASGLQSRAIGAAGRPSQLYQAFKQGLRSGNTIRPQIERLLRLSQTTVGTAVTAILQGQSRVFQPIQ
jgi:hypothetical protein